jgi:tetratricopeptide (TPR) repeat protein
MDKKHALAVLNRLVLRNPSHAGRLDQALQGRLSTLVDVAIDVAVETGAPVSQAAARLLVAEPDPSVAEQITRRCQNDLLGNARPLRELLLIARRATLEARRAAWRAPDDGQKARLALMAGNLAISLHSEGDTAGAAKLQREALALLRELAERHPRALRLALAKSLFNLAYSLTDLDDREEAIAVLRESRKISEDLVGEGSSSEAMAILASVLSNLGNELSEVGRHEEALLVSREAIAAFRRLSTTTESLKSNVVIGLERLGHRLAAAGRPRDALAVTEEANDILRNLIDGFPAIFLPDLARNLGNLAERLAAVGRREDAARSSEEAVQILKNLDPGSLDLAVSLTGLGKHLADVGDHGMAFAVTREAVEIARSLSTSHVPGSRLHLAGALNALGNRLGVLNRGEEALEAFREAVGLWQLLALEKSDDLRPDIAMGLRNLGMQLCDLGEREEAVHVTQEAVRFYRELGRALPGRFQPHLALNLSHLGLMLSDSGFTQEALAASREAVQIYRQLAELDTEDFRADLAMGLHNLGVLLGNAQQREDALRVTQEATALFRRLVLDRSLISGSRGAVVGETLGETGHLRTARTAAEQYHFAGRPHSLELQLSYSLFNLGRRWMEHQQWTEAIHAFEEADRYLRPVFEAHPEAFEEQVQAVECSRQDAMRQAVADGLTELPRRA